VTAPEFSRTVRADQIGIAPQSITVTASAEECALLVRRFGLATLDALSASLTYMQEGESVRLKGNYAATLAQICVVTGKSVPVTLSETLDIRFEREESDAAEIELSLDDCDILPYDGKMIDLGEAVAQSVALALDPYPRAAGSEDILRKAGVLREDEAGAFGALAGLRDQLGRS